MDRLIILFMENMSFIVIGALAFYFFDRIRKVVVLRWHIHQLNKSIKEFEQYVKDMGNNGK
jgi:hypothetical protein